MEILQRRGRSCLSHSPFQLASKIALTSPLGHVHVTGMASAPALCFVGVIAGLEGHNRQGEKLEGQTAEYVTVGVRDPRANRCAVADLVHVVAFA